MAYRVIARRFPGQTEHEVYRDGDAENATCLAESFFINQHALTVRVVDAQDRVIRDRSGREWSWHRHA